MIDISAFVIIIFGCIFVSAACALVFAWKSESGFSMNVFGIAFGIAIMVMTWPGSNPAGTGDGALPQYFIIISILIFVGVFFNRGDSSE